LWCIGGDNLFIALESASFSSLICLLFVNSESLPSEAFSFITKSLSISRKLSASIAPPQFPIAST